MSRSLKISSTSGAIANGQDQNTITVLVMNDNEYVSNEVVVLDVTGGSALFPNNSKHCEITTNSIGTGSVFLTSTLVGDVTITGKLSSNPNIKQDVTCYFSGNDNVNVSIEIKKNNADADGNSLNTLLIKTTDASGLNDIGNVKLFAEIMDYDGLAVFENKGKLISFTTNASGSCLLNLSSPVSFPVVVNIYDENLVKKNTTTVSFTRKVSPKYLYLITSKMSPISTINFAAGTNHTIFLISSLSEPVTLRLQGDVFFSSTSQKFLIINPEIDRFNSVDITIPSNAVNGSFTISIDYADFHNIDSCKINSI